MAEPSWWDELFARLFAPPPGSVPYKGATRDTAVSVGKQAAPVFKPIQDELARQENTANPSPKPSPTPAQQQAANPNLREEEQVKSAIGTKVGAVGSPLYGGLPVSSVYMGNKRVKHGQNLVNSPVLEDIAEVTAQINDWSPKKIDKFANLAVDAGLLRQPTKDLDTLEGIWQSLAIRSAKMWERGRGVTPWQLLERYGSKGGMTDPASGPITTTTVNRSINLTSPREAAALVDAALQQRLGRSPTDKERKEFIDALRSAEKKEPSVTTSTTTTKGAGTESVSSSTSSETSGGVDVAAFAREWSLGHNKDEAGQYQALSTYMPAFFAALESPI